MTRPSTKSRESEPPKKPFTFEVRSHPIAVEQLERSRWRVTIDGRPFATYCTESRARAAGRFEVRRRELWAIEGDKTT